MRYNILLIIFALFNQFSFGQPNTITDFTKVDKYALNVPDSVTKDITTLATYLTASTITNTAEKKIRALFVWVSQNITYDDSFDIESPFGNALIVAMQEPDNVLKMRRGVCMGYAQLFVAMAQAVGLKAEVVDGIIKQVDGKIPRIGHSWVAVRLRKKTDNDDKAESKWYLCDPTWATPSSKAEFGTINEEYFLAEPEDFIKNHLPLDPMWQLLERPVPVDIFSKETDEKIVKYVSKSSKNPFMFQDTINRFLKMDTLKRSEKAVWRMLHYNPVNEYIWFEVGKVYARKFDYWGQKIKKLINQSFLASTILADEEKFDEMQKTHNLYFRTFKNCFNQIEDDTIKKQMSSYSDAYYDAISTIYKSGYYATIHNKFVSSKNENASRSFEYFTEITNKTDSTFRAAHKKIKGLDSVVRRDCSFLNYALEKLFVEKKCLFHYEYFVEYIRNDEIVKNRKEANELLSMGRFYTKEYKNCEDTLGNLSIPRLNIGLSFYDRYMFVYEVEECFMNTQLIFSKTQEFKTAKELLSIMPSVLDASKCQDDVKSKWTVRERYIKEFIDANADYFVENTVINQSNLSFFYHNIALFLWNENTQNLDATIKKDIAANLNNALNSIEEAIKNQTIIAKKFPNSEQKKKETQYFAGFKADILKFKKEVDN